MNPVDTFLPMTLWILATAASILILIVVLGFYAYQKKRFEAGIKDFEGVASLAAQKDLLQAGKNELTEWIQDQKDEVKRLTGERQEQEMLRADLQRLEQECAVKDEGNQALRNEVGELENQRHVLSQALERLKKEIEDAKEQQKDAQTIGEDVTKIEGQLKNLTEDLNSKRNEQNVILRSVTENKIAIESLEKQRTTLEQHAEQFKEETEKSKDAAKQARHNLAEYKDELEKHRDEVEKLNKELERGRTGKIEIELTVSRLRDEERSLKNEIKKIEEELGQRPGDDISLTSDLARYSDLIMIQPACLSKELFSTNPRPDEDESQALQKLNDQLRARNLFFSSRVIDAFHTSLKCQEINPLTVLAGISGTGKTLLPVEYAKTMGMHSLVMSVQPRWDSPQDLFGFFNYLEKEYKATELSRSLIRFDPYNFSEEKFSELDSEWVKERMFLVLLDEMNLARTEYYFSEFLSKLELRRLVQDPSLPFNRQGAEIELDTGPSKDGPFRIWVPHNILFIGTMNEDETTQTLSDKVLDRSNILRFGKPEVVSKIDAEEVGEIENSNKYLSKNQWNGWKKTFDQQFDKFDEVNNKINDLNMSLNKIGRPFGFRVREAIGSYVANYPRVDSGERYKLAVADQIEQKIIPKIQGIDLDEKSTDECLDGIERIIDDIGDNALGQAFERSKEDSRSIGMFKWQGVTRSLSEGA
jgi:hypothetical protein